MNEKETDCKKDEGREGRRWEFEGEINEKETARKMKGEREKQGEYLREW